MQTENLLNLKIHKLTNAQYDREKEAGNLDPTALYLTPDNSFEVNPETFYITAGQRPDDLIGEKATAEGHWNSATGWGSHAEGGETIASGTCSHAEGESSVASGYASHAEGGESKAISVYAHAEGMATIASSKGAHSEGCITHAMGQAAHAEGLSTSGNSNITAETPYNDIITAWNKVKFTLARGEGAHAEGKDTLAFGDYAHTEGEFAIARGKAAHAEGTETQALQNSAHAEGEASVAEGQASHAEGFNANAISDFSHAEGYFATVAGIAAHAEGFSNKAYGGASHAEGLNTESRGAYSHAEGNNTATGGSSAHAEGESTVQPIDEFGVEILDADHEGIRTAWGTKKFTLANGKGAHAEGYNTLAINKAAHAEGESTIAIGPSAHAEGYSTEAIEDYSHAEGFYTRACGGCAHTEGVFNTAVGSGSHAEGHGSSSAATVDGFLSSKGYNNFDYFLSSAAATGSEGALDAIWQEFIAAMNTSSDTESKGFSAVIGKGAHGEGIDNIAFGKASHAEGKFNRAYGDFSHVEGGSGNIASGIGSHAEGQSTTASGICSHAEGQSTTVSGICSHAEGANTKANGNASHAEGYWAKASGDYSHAAGIATTAAAHQYVIGHYNLAKTQGSDPNSANNGKAGTAFIIGNGYGNPAQGTYISQSNAFRVDYNGKVYSGATGTSIINVSSSATNAAAYNSGAADYAELFEWTDKNINNEDRRGYFVTMDGENIRIANPGDYLLGIISSCATVLGNNPEDWNGRYIRDDFGCVLTEEFECEEVVVDEETGEEKTVMTTGLRYKENPDYDPNIMYIERDKRPEWAAVGMLGVLLVRDDGTCQVNGYCTVAEGGIATASETGYRVIKRVNDHMVKVIFR